jgi:carbon storage regulator CsrA
MLVLSRKVNEGVWITASNGERIHVVLVEIRGDKARIGFAAQPQVKLYRDELQYNIDAERRD